MPSTVFSAFRTAIENKMQIACTYDGHARLVCPHVVGWKGRVEHALVFQFAGGSDKGLPPGGDWRCFDLSKIRNMTIQSGKWHTGPSHTRLNSCVDRIDTEVRH